ncbi:metallophosphoesterase [Pararhodobacter oceanensis]|uniref:Metallophosphoesterase n=1 Tax=Pararhodobacter oceanensis TaxID=2172121 RepID=A0A2T8HPE4_9RHOB|nr:metallophosphoesterase [Pararhodobacter oceanensis]PVH27307.1 metallophosphoesterase [Pararhodobacter oceanensis]
MTQAWNIIPDIHADIGRLQATLDGLGDDAPFAFLGDFIDAGHNQSNANDAAVLTAVRDLVASNKAVAVMGNHELNAMLFHTIGPDGAPLRAHNDKNTDQHRSFIAQFGIATPEAQLWLDWFITLSLWLDLGGIRLVHACWNQTYINVIAQRRPSGRLEPEDLPEIAADQTPFARAVKSLTNGPEVKLPEGVRFHDFKGYPREHVRIAWWRSHAATWREAALSVKDLTELPDAAFPPASDVSLYPADAPPVFTGHYKMSGAPRIEAPRALCLDYPNTSCAYRWRGEEDLRQGNLVTFETE